MNAAAKPAPSNHNGRVSWGALISTGSLAVALVGGATAFVQSQINTVKELTAADRESIRRQLTENDRITDALRENKVDTRRFEQVLAQILKQLDELDKRVDTLEKKH